MRQRVAKARTTSSTVFSKFQITFQFNFVLKGLKANILTSCIIISNKVVIARAISFVHIRVSTVESPLHRENVTFRSCILYANRGLDKSVKSGWSHYNNTNISDISTGLLKYPPRQFSRIENILIRFQKFLYQSVITLYRFRSLVWWILSGYKSYKFAGT